MSKMSKSTKSRIFKPSRWISVFKGDAPEEYLMDVSDKFTPALEAMVGRGEAKLIESAKDMIRIYHTPFPKYVAMLSFLSSAMSLPNDTAGIVYLANIAIELGSPLANDLLSQLSRIDPVWNVLCEKKEYYSYVLEKCTNLGIRCPATVVPYEGRRPRIALPTMIADEYHRRHRMLANEWNNVAIVPRAVPELNMKGILAMRDNGTIRREVYERFATCMELEPSWFFKNVASAIKVKYAMYRAIHDEKIYRNGYDTRPIRIGWDALIALSKHSMYGILPLGRDSICNLIDPDSTVREYLPKELALRRFHIATHGIFKDVVLETMAITGSIIAACFTRNSALERRWAFGYPDPLGERASEFKEGTDEAIEFADASFSNYIKMLYTRMSDIAEYVAPIETWFAEHDMALGEDTKKELVGEFEKICGYTTDVDIICGNCFTDLDLDERSAFVHGVVGGYMSKYRSTESSPHRNKITGGQINVEIFRSHESAIHKVSKFHSGHVRHCFNGLELVATPSAVATVLTGINWINRTAQSKNPDKTMSGIEITHRTRGFTSPVNFWYTSTLRTILKEIPEYSTLVQPLTLYGTVRCHPHNITFHEYMTKYGAIMRRIDALVKKISNLKLGPLTIPPIDPIYLVQPVVDLEYNIPQTFKGNSELFKKGHLVYPLS